MSAGEFTSYISRLSDEASKPSDRSGYEKMGDGPPSFSPPSFSSPSTLPRKVGNSDYVQLDEGKDSFHPGGTGGALRGGDLSSFEVQEKGERAVPEDHRARKLNVALNICFSSAWSLCDAIAGGALLDLFIFILAGESNMAVGVIESLAGLVRVAGSVPGGIEADRATLRRARLLRMCGVAGVAGLSVFFLSVIWGSIWLLALSLLLLSAWDAFTDTVRNALFLDSLLTGPDRAQGISHLEMSSQFAVALGPLLSIVFLWMGGNSFTEGGIRSALVAGTAGLSLCCGLLLFWREVKPVHHKKKEGGTPHLATVRLPHGKVVSVPRGRLIGLLLTLIRFLSAFGAGMTVKFIPIFLHQHLGFSPVGIQVLSTLEAVLGGAAMHLCVRFMVPPLGPVKAGIWMSSLSSLCWVLLGQAEGWPAVVLFSLMRAASTSALQPVDSALLQDNICSTERGRWLSLESLVDLGGSSAAFWGGTLIEAYGYSQGFVVSGVVCGLSSLCRFSLEKLVMKEEEGGGRGMGRGAGNEFGLMMDEQEYSPRHL